MSSISRTSEWAGVTARLSTCTLVWFGVLVYLFLTKLVLSLFFPNAFALGLYALNFTQVVFFRRYGYLSAILVCVAYYFVWHALYVH